MIPNVSSILAVIMICLAATASITSRHAFAAYPLTNNLSLHGYLKADVIYDTEQQSGDRINYPAISTTRNNDSHRFRIHARESRIGLKYLDTIFSNDFFAYVEGDFFGGGSNSPVDSENISNATSFAIRHAFINYNNWTIGQTWSNYVDVSSFPETLDLSNDTGQAFLRQGLVKYRFETEPFTLSVAVENPETDIKVLTGEDYNDEEVSTQDPLFDFTTRAEWRLKKGHLSAQMVLRYLSASLNTNTENEVAFGVGVSGRLFLSKSNQLRFHYSTGKGIGRYLQEASGASAIAYISAGTDAFNLDLLNANGGYIAFRHKFSQRLRANLSAGFLSIDFPQKLPFQFDPNETERYQSMHCNLIWTLSPRIEMGVEHARVDATSLSGSIGKVRRFQLSTSFKF